MYKGQHERMDRLVKEKRHDPYKGRRKSASATVCKDCEAIYVGGRWTWEKNVESRRQTVCPACRRIKENYPAGHIELSGSFVEKHQHELLNLIRNREKLEKEHHPMERIMNIGTERGFAMVTTTGVHLARRIGEALTHSYQGELNFQYGDEEKSIKVFWSR